MEPPRNAWWRGTRGSRLADHVAPDAWGAARNALCALSVVAFQDATAQMPGPELCHGTPSPSGPDHTRVWRGRYLVTTEPYDWSENGPPRVIKACDGLGWPFHVMPQRIGLWTRMVLVSPVAPIVKALAVFG